VLWDTEWRSVSCASHLVSRSHGVAAFPLSQHSTSLLLSAQTKVLDHGYQTQIEPVQATTTLSQSIHIRLMLQDFNQQFRKNLESADSRLIIEGKQR